MHDDPIDWLAATGGLSQAPADGPALAEGYRRATAHPGVTIDAGCRISPEARISPREGTIVMGAGGRIAPGAIVQGAVRFGEHCSVQSYAVIIGYGGGAAPAGGITIGDHVRIAPHAQLIGADHVFDDPDRPIHEQGLRPAPIVIGDDVWIAGHATIIAGVRVGGGSVIGAGAVVTRDVPPMSICVGVPARIVGDRRTRLSPRGGARP